MVSEISATTRDIFATTASRLAGSLGRGQSVHALVSQWNTTRHNYRAPRESGYALPVCGMTRYKYATYVTAGPFAKQEKPLGYWRYAETRGAYLWFLPSAKTWDCGPARHHSSCCVWQKTRVSGKLSVRIHDLYVAYPAWYSLGMRRANNRVGLWHVSVMFRIVKTKQHLPPKIDAQQGELVFFSDSSVSRFVCPNFSLLCSWMLTVFFEI